MQQKGLGKGLSALMGEPSAPAAATPAATGDNAPAQLSIQSLRPGKYQPRRNFKLEQLQELANSIAQNGIMQPILVRPLDEEGNYEIVAGERRWRAAKLADLQVVPVIIRELSDQLALELALVENIQRADLSPIEEAAGYQRLLEEFSYTQEELAETVGKSRSHIANLLRLLNLPGEIKDMIDNGELSMGHARALIGLPNPLEVAQEVVAKGLSVRQTEALARRDPSKPLGRPRNGGRPRVATYGEQGIHEKDPDLISLEASISENLGLKVHINDRGSSGEICIYYASLEQLDDILRRLGESEV